MSLDVNKLKQEVDKIFHNTASTRDKMTRFLRRYKGEWWDLDKKGKKDYESTIYVNLAFSTVMTTVPLITDNRPIWSIRARNPIYNNFLQAYSLCLEYLWDKLELDKVCFEWALDACIMMVGILKVYYCPDNDEVKIEVVDPRNFFIAPGYDDIWNCSMCGVRERKPLSWVKSEYPEKGKDVQPDEDTNQIYAGQEQKYSSTESFETSKDFVSVYEVWFKDKTMEKYHIEKEDGEKETKEREKYPYGRVVTFANGVILNDQKFEYKHGRPPYVSFKDYLIPHQFVGMGEIDQIEELNKSFNRSFQLLDKHTQDYCDPPYLLDSGSELDNEAVKQAIIEGGSLLTYRGDMSTEPLKRVDAKPIDPTVTQHLQAIMKLIEEVSGVTDISKGMTTKSQRQSATEISTLIESSYTRTRQRVRNFEHSVKRLLYLVLEIMQQYYTEKRDFSIKKDSQIEWLSVTNQKIFVESLLKPLDETDMEDVNDYNKFLDLTKELGPLDPVYADFDIEIQSNSTLPMDKQSLANLLIRLLEMGGQNPVTSMPLWKSVLERLQIPNWKELISEMEENFEKAQQGVQ